MDEQVYPQMYRVENEHWWFVARQKILLNYLDTRLDLSSRSRVLDIGCGTGANLENLSARYDAYGIDVSPQAIEFCKKRGLKNLHLGNLASYPKGERFDLITMFDVLEHVPGDLELLREAAPFLKPDGHLLVTVPAFPSLWSQHDVMLHHQRRYSKQYLKDVFFASGYHVDQLTYLNSFLFPVAVAKRALARLLKSDNVNDLETPAPIVNSALKSIFSLETHIVPRGLLPFGLSLLCLARRSEL